MVALGFSFFAVVLSILVIFLFMRRRPIGTPLTWGEAMVAAVFAFAVMFIAYGVFPHQWLNYADNELKWRADKFVHGPGDIVDSFPFVVTYEKIRDFIAVGIYIVGLGVQIALWSIWQKRGQTKAKALPRSAFGRPLLKPAPRTSDPVPSGGS
jgi:hypothetical protein